MKRRMVIMLVAVAVVFGLIFGFQVFKGIMIKKFIAAASNPPQTVSAAKAGYNQWQPKIEAVGTLRAVKGADLSLEVSGVVEFDLVQFRRRRRGRRAAFKAAHRGRRGAAALAGSGRRVERNHQRA